MTSSSASESKERPKTSPQQLSYLIYKIERELPSLRRLLPQDPDVESVTLHKDGSTRLLHLLSETETLLSALQEILPHDLLSVDAAQLALDEFRSLCRQGRIKHFKETQTDKGCRVDLLLASAWSGGIQWDIRILAKRLDQLQLSDSLHQLRLLKDLEVCHFHVRKKRTFWATLPSWGSVFLSRVTDPRVTPYSVVGDAP